MMIISERQMRLLSLLLKASDYLVVDYMASMLTVSRRTIYNDIKSINQILNENKLGPLIHKRKAGYRIDSGDETVIRALMDRACIQPDYAAPDRVHFIFCILLGYCERVDIATLEHLTQVSRNTLFLDLKQIRAELARYKLQLTYTLQKGYHVLGSIIQKRSLFLYHLHPLSVAKEKSDYLFKAIIEDYTLFNDYLLRLRRIEDHLETEYIAGVLVSLAMLMTISKLHAVKISDTIEKLDTVSDSQEYAYVASYFPHFSDFDKYYYAIHLLGSLRQIRQDHPHSYRFLPLAISMVARFQILAAVEFQQVTLLVHHLANHLATSIVRYRYGLHQSNPLLEQIQDTYSEVYELSNLVCDTVRDTLHVPISASEVAYITLYFNSFIRNHVLKERKEILMIVCPQGLATSAMLQQELSMMFKNRFKVYALSLGQFNESYAHIKADYIVSTVPLDVDVPLVLVNPVLTPLNRLQLKSLLAYEHGSVDGIMRVIDKYVDPLDKDAIRSDMTAYFMSLPTSTHQAVPTFKDVFKPSSVVVCKDALDWQQAIHYACSNLITKRIITDAYPKAIIKAFQQFGPYMILEHGYVLLHASYGDGVHDLGLSFTKLEVPLFINQRKVNKLFVVAPVDQKQHLQIMRDLLHIFQDDTLHHKLDALHDSASLYHCLCDVL